ncbi:MAG: PH domain-containing protein [Flavobacteriaceae bacterium]|jgi:dolichyl-phosphate-mannose--protein O-mannosyl transferase|nr:PH domain-containing protein [Flavobacteriaceae bacterium]
MKQKFEADISYGIVLIIAILLLAMNLHIFKNDHLAYLEVSVLSLFSLLIVCFVYYILRAISYEIKGEELIVHSAFKTKSIYNIQDIRFINKTTDLTASSAPSLKRLEIRIGKLDSVLVSPKDKKNFIKALQNINPTITTDVAL